MLSAQPVSPCVLLVEDDTSLRQSLSISFEREKVDVDVAESVTEALRLLEIRKYAVIVIDLPVPNVNGQDLLSYIEKNRSHHDSEIVMITDDKASPGTGSSLQSSAQIFLKPVELGEVARSVRELCSKR